jgi:hypothetical protein
LKIIEWSELNTDREEINHQIFKSEIIDRREIIVRQDFHINKNRHQQRTQTPYRRISVGFNKKVVKIDFLNTFAIYKIRYEQVSYIT